MTGLENGQLDLEAAIFRARSGDVTLTQTEVRLLSYLLERPMALAILALLVASLFGTRLVDILKRRVAA